MEKIKLYFLKFTETIKSEISFRMKYDKAVMIKYITTALVIVIITGSLLVINISNDLKDKKESELNVIQQTAETEAYNEGSDKIPDTEDSETLPDINDSGQGSMYIDVSGAVINPGVVQMAEGSRVFQAVEMAGGLKSNADMMNVNLAAILHDGDKIYIPTITEVRSDRNAGGIVTEKATAIVSSASGTNKTQDGKINLNTASSEELQTISGIGPSTAQKIIEYRDKYGNFKTVTDLLNISGIGEKTLDKFKDKLTV